MILTDWQIMNLCRTDLTGGNPLIDPFEPGQIRADRDGNRLISYGTSSAGYDLRVADEFKIFTNVNNTVVDPKNFDPASFVDFRGPVCTIPPNSFALARSVEYIRMPRDMVALCLGKSTYARCGIICNFTPFEPGWFGTVTIEISNTTPLPARIYANEGIAQVVFFQLNDHPLTAYDQRAGGGKYQGQTGITTAKA